MSTSMKRFMISITPELVREADILKQNEYYNKSYAELYRHLIELGLKAAQAQSKQKNR